MNLLEKVKGTISRYGMLKDGDAVIIAVSGGPDSVALLHALFDLRRRMTLSLIVAHLNHGLRGKESDRDARFVMRMAGRLDLPCVVEKITITKRPGQSVQETARIARYKFLEKVAGTYHASVIATGHTADDQAETLLMRFLRGSGRKGLGGIPPLRKIETGRIVRPLIEIGREDLLDFLRKKKVNYVMDSSNRRATYLRNTVRKKLLPLLKRFNPRLIPHLSAISGNFREEDKFLEGLAKDEWTKVVQDGEQGVSVDIPNLRACAHPIRKRILMRAVRKAAGSLRGFSSIHFDMILTMTESASPNKAVFLPHAVRAERRYAKILITREKGKRRPWNFPSFEVPLRIPGVTKVEGLDISVRARVTSGTMKVAALRKTPAHRAYFDLEAITPPVVLRSFRAGDRFFPLGFVGTKKIKDLFIEKKIPRFLRGRIPILESAEGVLWVLGIRQSDRAKIGRKTRKILTLDIHGQIAA